jgi:glucose-1-phosphate cytidylyltransferase
MKAVILAGGLGTRLAEETEIRPKPMVEIGGKPILWHIMKIYAGFGVTDFIICLGYKGYQIKEYFINYYRHNADLTVNTSSGDVQLHDSPTEDWNITLVDTGYDTLTGGRLKRVASYLADEDFFMTYGDGVASIDLSRLLDAHRKAGRLATVTAVIPPGRFGALKLEDGRVTGFEEKPRGDGGKVNGGFFVLSPKVLDYIDGDHTSWETTPLERLVRDDQLASYTHDGFWRPMDTLRDKHALEELWASGNPPWKSWQ